MSFKIQEELCDATAAHSYLLKIYKRIFMFQYFCIIFAYYKAVPQ